MKIAFFLSSFPELSETFILRQITGLLDLGHDVRVIAQAPAASTITHPSVASHALLERTRFLSGPQSGAPRGSRRCRPRRALAGLRVATAMLPVRSARKKVAALSRVLVVGTESPPDIVHCHYGDIGLLWGFAAAMWRVPLVVSFYGYDCSVVPHRYGAGVYRPLFARAARVTALSGHMRQRLIDLGCEPDRIAIQPLGVDPDVFSFRERDSRADGRLRVLTVARLAEKKGLDDALRAVAEVRRRLDLEYEIIGEGPMREPLRRLAAELGIADVVRFRGARPQPDVVAAMHAADLFLLPSVTAADGDTEGTPTVLIEAASTGLPAISTVHAGIPEVVADGRTGLLVPERSPGRIASAISSLATDPSRRASMGRAARAEVESRFDTRELSRRLADLYHQAVAGR